jgi:hypothetical protein
MPTVNLLSFPNDIVQEGIHFCIPASVLSVLKYYDQNIKCTQFGLMQLLISNSKSNSPSLEGVIEAIKPQLENDYNFQYLGPSTFDEWKDNVITNLTKSYPMIFTSRNNSGPHVRVIIGFDELTNTFIIFDPGESGSLDKILNHTGNIIGSIWTIKSMIKTYTEIEAKEDWNKPNRCSDQLLISPKN